MDLKNTFINNVKKLAADLSFKQELELNRDLKQLQSLKDENALIEKQLKINEKLEHFQELMLKRKQDLPKISFNDDLPVCQKHDEILEAIKNNK